DAGRKLVEISNSFLMVSSRVFYPLLSRKISAHSTYTIFQICIASIFSVMLYVLAPLIINTLFTKEFEAAVSVLQIMALSLIFLSLNNIYGTNYMIVRGHERSLRKITTAVSIIGFAIAFPLVYLFDYIGAAIAITITRALLG